jgi:disulfide bond formation protein DsbB
MCIFFASKENVQEAYDGIQQVCFQKKVVVSERSDTWPDIGYAIAICCMVIPVILAIVSAHK